MCEYICIYVYLYMYIYIYIYIYIEKTALKRLSLNRAMHGLAAAAPRSAVGPVFYCTAAGDTLSSNQSQIDVLFLASA